MVEDLCIRWRTILLVISINESTSLWNISREKFFEVLKIILWAFSKYSSCFMWNVENWAALLVDGPGVFLWSKCLWQMTVFLEDSARLSNSKMKTTCLICWRVSSFFRCCFSWCYCSCQHGRSVVVSGYCLNWPFTCYFCTHCSDVKNLKVSVVRWTRCTKFTSYVKTPFVQFFFPAVPHLEFTHSIDFLMQSFNIFFDLF